MKAFRQNVRSFVIGILLLALLRAPSIAAAKDDKDAIDSSVALTKSTFEELTKDKTVFIKFYASYCGHCQDLAPAWEQLAQEFVNHKQGLVASVDCGAQEEFCRKDFDIQGLPTLLYGDPSEMGAYLHEYRDDKSAQGLIQFAKDAITEPMCSPANLDPCEPEMRKQIESVLKLSESELAAEIERKEQEIQEANTAFETGFEQMQAQYDTLAADHQIETARIKTNIQMIKAVIDAKASS